MDELTSGVRSTEPSRGSTTSARDATIEIPVTQPSAVRGIKETSQQQPKIDYADVCKTDGLLLNTTCPDVLSTRTICE